MLVKEITAGSMNDINFYQITNSIKTSDIYENPENWAARGLNPSDQSVIQILKNATNYFIENLEKIYSSNQPSETKLKLILNLVDKLSWYKLDTEEKEFLADTLAPAIESAGFNPWTIF